MRLFLCPFMIILLVSGFFGMSAISFVEGQDYTEVTGILPADTTWTKSSSPYSLTGPVLVEDNITLTIEAGVTVYLNKYYIQVEGTLSARGSSTDKIYFIDGSDPGSNPERGDKWAINFDGSDPWDEQTGSGSIIENAVLDSVGICVISEVKISNNVITAEAAVDIFESGFVLSDNIINGDIHLHESASEINITNNVITKGTIGAGSHRGSIVISNNTIQNGGSSGYGIGCTSVNVTDNIISGCKIGISAGGHSLVENNLIINNEIGIRIGTTSAEPVIRNNTITDNSVGIEITANPSPPSPTIIYNNIVNNTNNVYLSETSKDYNLTYNWWGTTDTSVINQAIFDSKNDFNLGTVNFVPFLTVPNPEAPEIPESHQLDLFTLIVVGALVAIAVAVVIVLRIHFSRKNESRLA